MEKLISKKILKGFLVVLLAGVVSCISMFFMSGEARNGMLAYGCTLISISLAAIFASHIIIYDPEKKLERIAKYSLFIFPVLLIAGYPPLLLEESSRISLPFVILIPLIIVFAIVTIFSLLYIFIYSDATGKTGTVLLLLFVLLNFVTTRYYIPYKLYTWYASLIPMSYGSIMFGIRCLYLSEGNTYFKYLSLIGNCLIAMFFIGILFKVNGWAGGGYLITLNNSLLVIGTIIILLTFPSSGYLDWKTIHKKILIRLLIPWIFMFFTFIMVYLMPGVWRVIFAPVDFEKMPGFEMVDYRFEEGKVLPVQ